MQGSEGVRERRLGTNQKSGSLVATSTRHVYRWLTVRTEILQGGCDMARPPSSKCAAPARRDDGREAFRDGIRMDGKRQHKRFREETRRRRSVGTCTSRSIFFLSPTISTTCLL